MNINALWSVTKTVARTKQEDSLTVQTLPSCPLASIGHSFPHTNQTWCSFDWPLNNRNSVALLLTHRLWQAGLAKEENLIWFLCEEKMTPFGRFWQKESNVPRHCCKFRWCFISAKRKKKVLCVGFFFFFTKLTANARGVDETKNHSGGLNNNQCPPGGATLDGWVKRKSYCGIKYCNDCFKTHLEAYTYCWY